MAKLYLKTIRNPITITKSQAVNIGKIYDDEKVQGVFKMNIDGVRFSKDDIRNIIENDPDDDRTFSDIKKSEENESYYSNVNKEYNDYIRNRCSMDIEKKAKDVRIFETMFFGITGNKINEKQKEFIQKEQLEYFKVNPSHPYANINYYKFIKDHPDNKDGFNMKYNIASASLRNISKIIIESFTTAKHLGLIK